MRGIRLLLTRSLTRRPANLGSQTSRTITATATITAIVKLGAIASGQFSIAVSGSTAVNFGAVTSAASYQERAGQIVAAINDKTGQTGVFAFITSGNKIKLQGEDAVTAAFVFNALSATVSAGTTSIGLGAFKCVKYNGYYNGRHESICGDIWRVSNCDKPS